MKRSRQTAFLEIRRSPYFICASVFLFFLVYSAPHRVHHFFDQFPQTHDHGDHDHSQDNDRDNRSDGDSKCVFQTSASRCQLSLAASIVPASSPIVLAEVSILSIARAASSFFPKKFQIRAPPPA
jgi:hypothetical protein